MPERYTAIDRPGIPGRFFFIGVVPELQLYGSRHCVDLAVVYPIMVALIMSLLFKEKLIPADGLMHYAGFGRNQLTLQNGKRCNA